MKTHQTPVREEHGASCSCKSCPQPEKQAADNSRRAKKGRDKAVPEGGEPARLSRGTQVGTQRFPGAVCRAGELRFAACAIRGLYFLASCPAVQNC